MMPATTPEISVLRAPEGGGSPCDRCREAPGVVFVGEWDLCRPCARHLACELLAATQSERDHG